MIDLWVRGELEGKLSRGEGEGLHAIEVDWDILSEKRSEELESDLTLRQAASYLKLSVIGIRHLRDNGYFEVISRRNPDTKHVKQYLTQNSISEFESKYITLGQLAPLRRVAPIHLARRLDQENIWPITCGKENVRVYDRDLFDWVLPIRRKAELRGASCAGDEKGMPNGRSL